MTFIKIPESEAGDYVKEFSTSGPCCTASDRMSYGFICTRSGGHIGPHIAHGASDHAIAKWGGEDEDLELDKGL